MIFFDFLFYRIYQFYTAYKERGAESSSAGIVGGLQVLNLLTIIMLILGLLGKKNTKISTYLVIGVFLFFQIHTYIRYIYGDRNSAKKVKKKWLSKTDAYRGSFISIQYVYICLSILTSFGIAIYLGAQKNI